MPCIWHGQGAAPWAGPNLLDSGLQLGRCGQPQKPQKLRGSWWCTMTRAASHLRESRSSRRGGICSASDSLSLHPEDELKLHEIRGYRRTPRLSRSNRVRYVRDVGVAGSHPVTPTIDFRIFLPPITIRCQVNSRLGVSLNVSFAAKKLLDVAAVSGHTIDGTMVSIDTFVSFAWTR
jgi:hypothetical protein